MHFSSADYGHVLARSYRKEAMRPQAPSRADHIVEEVDQTVAAVLILSIEPLVALARQAKFHSIAEQLKDLAVQCEVHGGARHKLAPSSEGFSHEIFVHGVAEKHLLSHSVNTYRTLSRRCELVTSELERYCGGPAAAGLSRTLEALNQAKSLIAWLAATLPAQSDQCLRAKAEILVDWVGHDAESVADQLSSVLCREILAKIPGEPPTACGGTA
jgi:hypothetical protein